MFLLVIKSLNAFGTNILPKKIKKKLNVYILSLLPDTDPKVYDNIAKESVQYSKFTV